MANSRFALITRDNVIWALGHVDEIGYPRKRGSKKFCLSYGRSHYPPKLVLEYAYQKVSGKPLFSENHSGGPETNQVLARLGFTITDCSCGGSASGGVPSAAVATVKVASRKSPKLAFLGFCGGTDSKRLRLIEKSLVRASRDGAKLLIVPESSIFADGPFGATSDTDNRLADAVRSSAVGLIIGRFEERRGDHYRLRADILDESGQHVLSYYKHADPSYGTSPNFESAFEFLRNRRAEFPVANLDGLRVGILICHDVLYPALAEQYAGAVDLLVTISGASNDTKKWLTFISERSRELNVPVTHICSDSEDMRAPGSVAVVASGSRIHCETSHEMGGPKTFKGRDCYVVADLSGPYKDLAAFLSVSKGARPMRGRKIRIDGSKGVVPVKRAIIESGSKFQRVVSKHIGDPVLYLVENAKGVAESTIRARAIENVVPIAIHESGGYRIFNPNRYRQVSSYFDHTLAVIDEERQAAGAVFKRIPEAAYLRLLA